VPTGVDWIDYIAGHPERLPRTGGVTWGDVPPDEYQRVTRNWRRWQRRRGRRGAARPVTPKVREPGEAD